MTALLFYDAVGGSDTAPSDRATNGSGSSASGTGAASTITLGATVDLTSTIPVADDGTDYIWCSTTAGERHLFRITSFTGGAATCTAVVVAEAIGATTFSGANWHINGSRQTFLSDATNRDWEDWMDGWSIEFEAGTYTTNSTFNPGASITWTHAMEPIYMLAAPGAVSRPVITQSANSNMLKASASVVLHVAGLKFDTTHTGTSPKIDVDSGSITLVDCVVDASFGSATEAIECWGGNRSLTLTRCYVTGGTTYVVKNLSAQVCLIDSCVIDGQGSYGTTAGVSLQARRSVIRGSVVGDCDGDGISVDNQYGVASPQVLNNTIVDNTGDGIVVVTSSPPGATAHYHGRVENNIIAFNGLYGVRTPISLSDNNLRYVLFINNATYSNTSGAYIGQITAANSIGAVTLTADPFTNRAANDYTLNNTAGGGADCRAAAYPAALPDGT